MKTKCITVVMTILAVFCVTHLAAAQDNASKTFTNSIGIEFALIPVGEFLMGTACNDNPFTEKDECGEVVPDEAPAHKVVITQPLYMSRTEVTQEQWYLVMGNNPANFKSEKVGMDSRHHPVEMVSWDDAQEFVRRLNKQEGVDVYRLPTEAEWEYACRAGTDTVYAFGDDRALLPEYAWYQKNSGGTTHQVGQTKPNAWGLYDMHGNVWEWCEDVYIADIYATRQAKAPVADPVYDPMYVGGQKTRVFRGGSWGSEPSSVRSAERNDNLPASRDDSIGFRIVRIK